MKRKIKPGEQTEELGKAKVGFLKRDKENFDQFIKDKDLSGLIDEYGEEAVEEIMVDLVQPPAVTEFFPALDDANQRAFKRFCKDLNLSEDEITLAIPLYRRAEGFYKYYLQEIQKNSKKILKDVMGENPSTHVLVSIDITRPMEVVLAELKKLISRNKKGLTISPRHRWVSFYDNDTLEYMKKKLDIKESNLPRLKWLSIANELLEVWDLYEAEGKTPGTVSFSIVSKIVGRPISTVKSQWKMAYEKIYGVPYTPEIKFTNEGKKPMPTLCVPIARTMPSVINPVTGSPALIT